MLLVPRRPAATVDVSSIHLGVSLGPRSMERHPVDGTVDECLHANEADLAAAELRSPFGAGRGEVGADLDEVGADPFEILERDPASLTVDRHRRSLVRPLLARGVGAILNKVEHRVVGVIDAPQQDVGIEAAEACKRSTLAVRVLR